jgi:hypothetical protein
LFTLNTFLTTEVAQIFVCTTFSTAQVKFD